MNIFDFYKDPTKHNELGEILTLGAQRHQYGLPSNFLEKDIWVNVRCHRNEIKSVAASGVDYHKNSKWRLGSYSQSAKTK